ncbi:MAG TPA: hypothetical protein VK612_03280 [Pyrinomonadaceae bacterium]|nr:hypothetical protein [Pyrinomonadaceae bacterium]
MRSFNFKKIVGISALGLVAVLGMSESASAQGGWRNDQKQERKIDKQQQKIQKQRGKIQQQQNKLQAKRYRVNRNGSYYNTDQRGAEMLRQAVNAGYQQGYRSGQQDRNGRRNSSWNNSSVDRNGTYGYQSHVDRSQYQYYFQQGFQKGYQDGYNSQNRYGSNNGGSMNILGTILNQVLNIQQY